MTNIVEYEIVGLCLFVGKYDLRIGSFLSMPLSVDSNPRFDVYPSSLQIKVQGTLSVSAGDEVFNSIKEEDKLQYDQFIWSYVYRSLRILAKWGLKRPLRFAINSFNRKSARHVRTST